MFRCKIILLSLYLLTSCKVVEESIETKDSDLTSNKDTVKNTLANLLEDSLSEAHLNIKPNKILLTSGEMYYPPAPIYHDGGLRIIEVKNTKVIKQGNDLSEGRIVYKIPERMRIRSINRVIVRISKSKASVSLYDSLSGEVRTSRIPVTETMEVKLVDVSPKDNRAFDIVDGNSAVQIVENGDTYTEWSWDVTPIKVGKSKLKIVVSVIRNGNKKDLVYEDSVDVERDVIAQTSFFFKKYWQVLMTSIAIPFIVWLYKSRKEKQKNKNEIKENEDEKQV